MQVVYLGKRWLRGRTVSRGGGGGGTGRGKPIEGCIIEVAITKEPGNVLPRGQEEFAFTQPFPLPVGQGWSPEH